ncbi:DEKNAAC102362 [Brettanomyces naardenensis]|uniref:DEKNAAC102362 n=1 Tax=Brettanomyces naardenensis TaxID=13370 RepID=A0A448YKH4_BRENA|nr:DEKNAAC102362 [Brettanomyces naardenensis]
MSESVKVETRAGSGASEYQSHALSRKERRQVKKAEKRQRAERTTSKKGIQNDTKEDINSTNVDLGILEVSEDEKEVDDFEEEKDDVDEEAGSAEEIDDEDVPYSDVELDDDADVVPHQKLTVNNAAALRQAYERIHIPWEKYQFDESQSITYSTKVEEKVKDIYDDTERELQFFKQGLDAANEGRKKLTALKVAFSRPADYFAEMVKSDEHMEKLKLKLVEEATEKKAREEAKRQRQLKKFGKQVQHETLQQRQKEKRGTLDKIKSLRKKRQNSEIGTEEFDIAVEEASAAKEETSHKKRRIQNKVVTKSKGNKRPGKSKRRHWKK